MSDVQKGASRVRAVERQFHAHGFRTAIVSRSGQRRGARKESLAVDGDLIALAPAESGLPHYFVEVGGLKKSAKQSFAEMKVAGPIPPGFALLCVRLVESKGRWSRWRWHREGGMTCDTIEELLHGD